MCRNFSNDVPTTKVIFPSLVPEFFSGDNIFFIIVCFQILFVARDKIFLDKNFGAGFFGGGILSMTYQGKISTPRTNSISQHLQ